MCFVAVAILLLIPTLLRFSVPDIETKKIVIDSFKDENGKCAYDDVEQLLTNYIHSDVNWMDDPIVIESETMSAQAKAKIWLKEQNQTEMELCSPYSTLQRYVLAILYYSTDGNHWMQRGKFLSDDNVCHWRGVFCDESDTVVTKLVLDSNYLHGKIPDEIGALKYLEKLQFGSNSLDGTLPSTIGKLESLQVLHIGDNSLTGSIPTELGDLTSLHIISLYENHFTGFIPSEFVNLKELKGLFLSDNDISGDLHEFCLSNNLVIQVDCRKIEKCQCCVCK